MWLQRQGAVLEHERPFGSHGRAALLAPRRGRGTPALPCLRRSRFRGDQRPRAFLLRRRTALCYTQSPTFLRGAAPLREVRAEALPEARGRGFRPGAALARSAASGPSAALSEETRPRWWVRAGVLAVPIGLHPPRGAVARGRGRRFSRGRRGPFAGGRGAGVPWALRAPRLPQPA